MFDALTIAAVGATFLLAGTVKGVIGLGLPTISLGLLTATLDLTTAMALLIAPSFVTNLWQALAGGNTRALIDRLWPFLLMATLTVWLGALALTRIDLSVLSGLLGALLVAYAVSSLLGMHFTVSRALEDWAGPVLGFANGVLTGMTGSFVVPGVMYLQAIGLRREMLVQAMGMLFTLSTLALAAALQNNGLLNGALGVVSAAAVLPAIAGMFAGQVLRQRLSEDRFRRLLFVAILLLGLYLITKSVLRVI